MHDLKKDSGNEDVSGGMASRPALHALFLCRRGWRSFVICNIFPAEFEELSLPLKEQWHRKLHSLAPLNNLHQLLSTNPSVAALVSLLKKCGQTKALADGKIVHAHITGCNYGGDTFLGNWLIKMYGECGSISDAKAVFDRLPKVNLYSWNILMKAFTNNGFFREAFECLQQMQLSGFKPDHISFICALNGCASQGNLEQGLKIHASAVDAGFGTNVFVGTALVDMYGKCGSLEDAGNVFHLMPHRNVATWNAMMGACAQNGHGEETLNLLNRMHGEGLKPDEITFMCALDACAGLLILEKGKEIHAAIADGGGCKKQVAVGNALVRMYGKCGSLEDARSVFSEMHDRNVASWNVMMSACTQNGQGKEALDLYNQMQQERIKPNEVSFICALDACTSLTALHRGQEIHAAIVNGGYEGHVVVGTTLINMYGKCGRLEDARSIFDRMTNRDVVAWNSMIAACVLNGHGTVALDLFDRMQCDGLAPNQITFVSALDACASQAAHEKGKQIRAAIVKGGYEEQVVVGTALINMYSKLGNLDDARNLFNRMPQRNVVSWNAMIAALARNGHGKEALDLFDTMQHNGLRPDHITFVSALDACARQAALEKGQEIHSAILDSGCEGQVNVGTALVHMYGKCGNLEEARSVFARMPQRNLVTWNAMIAACSQNGHCKEALELFNQMDCDGIAPNQITYLCALDACASLAVLDEGQRIHAAVSEDGYEGEVAVANALINMYGKCENLEAARSVFNRMPNRDVVSWNAMITACSQNGHGKVALEYFYQMQLHGISPDRVTYICALDAASSIAALDKGQEIHSAILREGYEGQVIFGNALVSMYGKCGSLEDARIVFNQMPQRDVISWNSMIAVFAQNGHGEEALDAFDQMQRDGFEPDHVTFLSVLAACSHTGRVDDATRFFESMSKDHGVSQKLAHYMCLIDILGRAGHLDDAEKLINNMPFESEASVWLNLLGACRVHGDVERGIRAASHVFAMDPENPTPYVLLSNLIASAGMCNMR